jgi:hypothetical protein
MEILVVLIIGILSFVMFAFVFGCILALPVMWLWNWLMPIIFQLPDVTFWQAWGLLFLSALLIKSAPTSSSS